MRIKMGIMALAFTAMGYGCDDGDSGGDGAAFGAECVAGQSTCASGLCVPDAAGDYCSEMCTPGSCSAGFECKSSSAGDICQRAAGNPEPEANPEPGPEGNPEPGPEGNPEPGPEGNPEPGPEGNPEPGPEGNPEPGPEGNPEPGMDLDCAGINECLSACGQGDMACINGCIESGTPTAQEEFLAIIDCIQANGGDQEPCQAEIQQCLGAAPMGDGECPDFYACAGDCPEDSQDCVQNCFNGLAPNAQNLVLDIVNCVGPVVDANPDAGDEELNDLINEACAAQIEACFGAPVPPGEDTCGEVVMCVMPAMSQEEVQACFNEGTEQAREQYQTLVTCIVDAECMDFNCPACQAELDACNGGGGPEPEPMPEPMPEGEPEGNPEPMPEPMPEGEPEGEPEN